MRAVADRFTIPARPGFVEAKNALTVLARGPRGEAGVCPPGDPFPADRIEAAAASSGNGSAVIEAPTVVVRGGHTPASPRGPRAATT